MGDLSKHLHPITGSATDYQNLLESVAGARFVLLGEASHGTHEFYRERARITQLLISQYGFNSVAVEADWPDAFRVNCFVKGYSDKDYKAEQALGDFNRFPQWMWRNSDVVDFVEWLHKHNASQDASRRVGFYGIDLYSLYTSIDAVVKYLDRT